MPTLGIPHTEAVVDELLKDDNRPVLIAGGPHPTVLPDEMLSIGFDYIAIGEAEETIIELMAFIYNKPEAKSLDEIDGIAFKRDGSVIKTNKRKLLDVNTLPFPAWKYFKVDNYKGYVRKLNRCLPIMGGRGCPEKCTFCYKGIFGTSLRVRRPELVVDEIQYLKDNFQIEEFVILDENFTLVEKYVLEFCELLIERKINLPWHLGSGVRVDKATEKVVDAMKRAGCYRASLGVESGNEDILNEINKRITKQQVRDAVALYTKYGYEVTLFFIIGAPSDTRETVLESINFAIELNPDLVQFNIVMPFPGTALFDYFDSAGSLLTKDWHNYNMFSQECDPVFTHQNLSWDELRELRSKAYRMFYFRFGYIVKQIRSIRSLSDVKLLFKKMGAFLGFLNIIGRLRKS